VSTLQTECSLVTISVLHSWLLYMGALTGLLYLITCLISVLSVDFSSGWTGVATWRWVANDDTCGICRLAFDGCCPDCKLPGDDCPLGQISFDLFSLKTFKLRFQLWRVLKRPKEKFHIETHVVIAQSKY